MHGCGGVKQLERDRARTGGRAAFRECGMLRGRDTARVHPRGERGVTGEGGHGPVRAWQYAGPEACPGPGPNPNERECYRACRARARIRLCRAGAELLSEAEAGRTPASQAAGHVHRSSAPARYTGTAGPPVSHGACGAPGGRPSPSPRAECGNRTTFVVPHSNHIRRPSPSPRAALGRAGPRSKSARTTRAGPGHPSRPHPNAAWSATSARDSDRAWSGPAVRLGCVRAVTL